MLVRLLCFVMLLVLGPTAAAFADCCEADRSCCAGEAPACPVEPGGECSIAVAHPIAPVAELRVDATPAMEPATVFGSARFDLLSVPCARAASSHVPHSFLRFSPLRN